ncbi:HAD family hydrolase [Staphylococcus sp. SQ8-PEA]|uniref:HAD family hydrolase n=1 Tax=Staphylococcus marylandisciuri TaxID=2981529 RepID=A0ABT2QSM7_9STAP|nr:HAD family hydrolase [Staphylococcus marylandisciuri]MCU5746974.1 HAD family hydrolase [Staphylococcus marylandisciuri]
MIFVIDVDGTICFNGRFIEDVLHNELERLSREHRLIFASARPIRDLVPVVKSFENLTLIGGNGAIISQNKEVSVIKSISTHEFEAIKKLILENNLEYIIDGSFDYSAKVTPDNKIYKQLDPDALANNVNIEDITEPIKVILVNLTDEMFDYVKSNVENLKDNLSINYHEDDNNIDITAKDVNKYTTLRKVIDTEDYIAFGNDINDYELLKHAKKAYIIGEHEIDSSLGGIERVKSDAHAVAEALTTYLT